MSELLDPSHTHAIFFVLALLAALGVGYTAGGSLGMLGSVLFTGFLGFVAGLYTSREETDIFAALVLTGGFTALVGLFLPLSVNWSVAIFLVGFIVGMRTERR